MKDEWVLALIAPDRIRGGGDRVIDTNALAFATLVDGRISEYLGRQKEQDWPALGSAIQPGDDLGRQLVSALGQQLLGDPQALEAILALSPSSGTLDEVGAAIVVVASIALSDAGVPSRSADLLAENLELVRSELLSALLTTHLALRRAEQGDAALAVESAIAAAHMPIANASPSVRRALKAVNRRNLLQFKQLAGIRITSDDVRPWRSALIIEAEHRAQIGLAAFLDEHFVAAVEDPNTTTLQFRREDPVETPLVGALLRSECLGDWSLQRDARRRLGRYRLLTSVGRSDRQPEGAFQLLRRAGDKDGLVRGLRLYRYEGPLEPLSRFGNSVVQMPWAPTELAANLVVLRETADLVEPDLASAGVARIIDLGRSILRPAPMGAVESEAMSALSALLRVAEPSAQVAASRWLRALISESTNPLLTQSAAGAIQSLQWDELPQSEIAEWLEIAKAGSTAHTDARFVANAVIASLGAMRPDRIAGIVRSAYDQESALDTGALLEATVKDLPAEIRQEIAERAIQDLERIRSSAAEGQYGFGGPVRSSVLLARLAVDHPRRRTWWRALAEFLTDPHVAPDSRAAAIEFLASNVGKLPSNARSILSSERLDEWVIDLPFEEPSQLRGAAFRLRLGLGMESLIAVKTAIEMANDADRKVRFQAALSIPNVAKLGGSLDGPVAIALSLSRDRYSEVRAAASRGLPALYGGVNAEMRTLIGSRISELLRDEGTPVPTNTLLGLSLWPEVAFEIPEISSLLAGLRQSHVSAIVRSAAEEASLAVERIGSNHRVEEQKG